ncbi:MAG: hypothetical protein H6739_30170 [Alphaproteobacteria bacterium]|nr:hypothetical protein [Alphaproteobacteria bacterium]
MSTARRDAVNAVVLSLGGALWSLRFALGPDRVLGNWRHPDVLSNHWLLEWVAERLATGQSLLHNDAYYWPVGDAPLLAGNGMEGFPYAPFAWALDWPMSVTAFAVALLTFNGLAAYGLARAAGAAAAGGWLAAMAVAAHPYPATELSMGHFPQADLGWMMLSLAALLRFDDTGRTGWGLAAGLAGGVCALLYWYHGVFLGIAAVVLTLGRPLRWPGVLAGLAGAAAVAGPWLAVSLTHIEAVPGFQEATFPAVEATEATLLLDWPVGALGPWQQGRVWPLAVALLAPLGIRRGGWRWAALAALAFGLGLGGALYEAAYGWAALLRRFWWPYRHGALWLIAGAVLAARGVSVLPARRWAGLLLGLTLPWMLTRTGDARPVRASPATLPPAAAEALAALPDGLVIEPPLSPRSSSSQVPLIEQRFHHKPLLTGHAPWVERVRPRAWDEAMAANPFLAGLQRWERGGAGDIPIEGLDALRTEGAVYLVVNPGLFAQALAAQPDGYHILGEALGREVARERGVVIYALDRAPPPTVALPPVRWPGGLKPAGPRHPLNGLGFPDATFDQVLGAPR